VRHSYATMPSEYRSLAGPADAPATRSGVEYPGWLEWPGGQQLRQRRAVDELHHQERRLPGTTVLAVVVYLRDRLMGNSGGVPRLGPEPGKSLGVLGIARLQQLHGHRPAEHKIDRAGLVRLPPAATRSSIR
jgi:hypothetical protein